MAALHAPRTPLADLNGDLRFLRLFHSRSPPAPPPPPPPHAQWIQADAYCKHKSKYDEYISMGHWPITCAKDGATQDECVGGDEWITSGDLDSCKERWCDGANGGGDVQSKRG